MNIDPLKLFLQYEMSPSDLTASLDKLLDDYIDLIVTQQLTDNDERKPDIRTLDFIHTIRRLRDVFAECR